MERTVVEDTTTEALVCILEGTPRGVMVVKDELSGWIRSMDQYKAGGKGADRQFYLSAWSNSPVAVDRKSQQEPVMLPRPSVGVFGSIQPGVLPELDSGREDGLLDRFLFAYPAPMRSRWSDAEISVEARLSVAKLYERLLALPMPGDEHGDPDPVRVEFSLDAKTVFVEVVNGLREEMELPGFPERLKGPWSKLESYLARLCLILAMARAVQGVKGDAQVEAEDVLKAAAILDYFKNHARRVYVGLHGESSIDRLAADVARFLDDRGGYWKGEPSELHGLLQSSAKPKDARWLSRRLEAIAERYGSLRFDSGNVWKEGQSRRFVELVLENSVNSVNSVKGGEGLEPDAARNHEPPVIPEVAERVRQALEERLKTRPRLINDTPAGIAAELFIHTDLGAAPEEVEEALKRMKA
jgi:hypothetical protein